jgi:hypothetical protein
MGDLKEKVGRRLGEQHLKGMAAADGGRKGLSMADVQSVHILFHAPTISSWKQLLEILRQLREVHGIPRVSGVAYTPMERAEVPTNWYTVRGIELHTAEDIDWRFEPSLLQSKSKSVDVLLDLNLDDTLPLLFEAKVAKAKFRVGPHREKEWVRYDFMLESCKDAQEFATAAFHYMNTLHLE